MVVLHSQPGGWTLSSRRGLFPLSVCWLPEPGYSSHSGSCHSRLGRPVEKFAQVKQGLVAQLEDELELRVGQVVKVTHVIDKDWFR